MYEELVQINNDLTSRMNELEKELKLIKTKYECVNAFAKGMSYNNPLQYEKLTEELKRLEEDGQDWYKGN